jgi:peptidoglycan/LPS O-acetylase OafA/YrhL
MPSTVAESPRPARTPQTFASIQALRGLAAVATVVGHLYFALPQETAAGQALWAVLAPFALPLRAAVDVFFVISGFVMMAQIDRPVPPDWASFLTRRLIRIYPLYWLSTLTLVPGVLFGIGLATRPGTEPPSLLFSLALLPQAMPPVLAQGWSLVHEMVFYAIVSLILAAGLHRRALAVVGVLGLVAVAQSAAAVPLAHGTLFSAHIVEFLAGMTIWRLRHSLTPAIAVAAGVAAIVGLVAVAAAFADRPVEPLDVTARVVLYGIPAGLCVLCAVGLEGLKVPARLARPWRIIGDTSYSLYLFHQVPLAGAAGLGKALGLGQVGFAILLVPAILLAVGYGVVMGRMVELPLHRLLVGRLTGRTVPAVRSAAAE